MTAAVAAHLILKANRCLKIYEFLKNSMHIKPNSHPQTLELMTKVIIFKRVDFYSFTILWVTRSDSEWLVINIVIINRYNISFSSGVVSWYFNQMTVGELISITLFTVRLWIVCCSLGYFTVSTGQLVYFACVLMAQNSILCKQLCAPCVELKTGGHSWWFVTKIPTVYSELPF